jgi:PilZ domain
MAERRRSPTKDPDAVVLDFDLRAEIRVLCPEHPALPLTRRGAFEDTLVRVQDISAGGIGLLTTLPLEVGTRVALLWEYGRERHHRTVIATVVHAAKTGAGHSRIGCAFEVPLTPDELAAFLAHRKKA